MPDMNENSETQQEYFGKTNRTCLHWTEWEKRAKELETENTELKDKLNNLASVAEVRLANWQKYEKENAELKEKLEHRNCVDCSNHGSNIKLLKAKEIIKELSDAYEYVIHFKEYADREVLARAKQFIKEE